MSVNGIGPIVPPPVPTPPTGVAAARVTPTPAGAEPAATSDVRPPDGTDPALWQLLTPDEQAFFARRAAAGPLSYGPGTDTATADAPRGQRIDVRA